jgi:hypothetical protein
MLGFSGTVVHIGLELCHELDNGKYGVSTARVMSYDPHRGQKCLFEWLPEAASVL